VRFRPLELPGAFAIELEPQADERGFFARSFCAREFAAAGLDARLVQASLSWSPRRGTLRGLHWQAAPHAEAKVVRCVRGRIWDVLVDVRPESPRFRRHVALELTAEGRGAVYIPAGVAHGFLTLEEGCEVHYQMSELHAPEAARGARYDDPAFALPWPAPVELVSARDLAWPAFSAAGC
jgi:dTDP-4-dehydrorhamnose 3,5-epimerase